MIIQPVFLYSTIIAVLLVAIVILIVIFFFKITRIEKSLEFERRYEKRVNRSQARKIEKETSERLGNFLKASADKFEAEIHNQLQEITETATKQSQQMGQFMHDQQSAVIKESQLMVANIVLKAQKEAEEYRKNQIERLEGQVNSIVAAAAREVLGRMISITEHEDLVKQALERAKKDKFFAV